MTGPRARPSSPRPGPADGTGSPCIVLGRGADEAQVIEWVKIGASVDGFDGFAVGRTLWQDALKDFLAGKASRPEAVDRIAQRYRDVIDAYRAPSRRGALMASPAVKLLLADVDGTLVTQQKELTPRAIDAVHKLHDAGVMFAVTSGRPPRGMAMLTEPLDIKLPIAGFNGGVIVNPDMSVIEQRVLPEDLVVPVADMMGSFKLDVWLYSGADWYVPKADGPHVDREAWTVKFQPEDHEGRRQRADRQRGQARRRQRRPRRGAARHPGGARQVRRPRDGRGLAAVLPGRHPPQGQQGRGRAVPGREVQARATDDIATIGDMPNDVLMFAHSGLSIAMGNASAEVKRAARRVTSSNEDEGFATAVERFILR